MMKFLRIIILLMIWQLIGCTSKSTGIWINPIVHGFYVSPPDEEQILYHFFNNDLASTYSKEIFLLKDNHFHQKFRDFESNNFIYPMNLSGPNLGTYQIKEDTLILKTELFGLGARYKVEKNFKKYSFTFKQKIDLLEIESNRLEEIGLQVNGNIYKFDSGKIIVPRKEIRQHDGFLNLDKWIPIIDISTKEVVSYLIFSFNKKGNGFIKTSEELVWITEKYLWRMDGLVKISTSQYFELYPSNLFLVKEEE